jgi:hypothetical protein
MKVSMYNMELDITSMGMAMDQQEFDPLRTPYAVDENTFPRYELLIEQFRFLLQYAILAPSSYNTQPWKFALHEEGIAVYADYTRRLPVVDAGNRELIMGVGAAILNLRVAAAHFGFDCRVEYNQAGDSERPLAFMHLTPTGGGSQALQRQELLFPAITKRHTNRNPFLMARVPEQVIAAVKEQAISRLVSVFISRDGVVNQRVADLVAEADRIQQADPSFRRELSSWLRPNHSHKGDGIRGASVGMNDLVATVGPWATRTFDLGGVRAAHDRNLCLEAPGLIVLHSEDSPAHWLETGEILESILLTLTRNTVQFSFFNMPIEVPEVRLQLRTLLGLASWPQLLLRIGYCLVEPALSPRRPADEVTIVS